MGSLRSLATRRADDTAVLTQAECPALAENETITYWTKLPYSAAVALMSRAIGVSGDTGDDEDEAPKQKTDVRMDVGQAAFVQMKYGIVEWTMRDAHDEVVPWDPDHAMDLLDMLDPPIVALLSKRIDKGSPPSLAVKVDAKGEPLADQTKRGRTEGKDSAGS